MSSSKKELKHVAKVEKKQKRREEKDAKKKLKKTEKKEKKRLKKLKKEQKKEQKKLEKERKKRDDEKKKKAAEDTKKRVENPAPVNHLEEKIIKNEKREFDQEKKVKEEPKPFAPVATFGDREALQFLATFGSVEKKRADKSAKSEKRDKSAKIDESSKSEKREKHKTEKTTHKDKTDKTTQSEKLSEGSSTNNSITKKPKLENKKKQVSVVEVLKPLTSDKISSVPTPATTPVPISKPTLTTPVLVSKPTLTTTVNSGAIDQPRKPVGIRKPGANREINPIYTKPIPETRSDSDFIIPGLNDTEESRILTKTFSSKWYLPPKLNKIEADTGLKYRRGNFSEAEKVLAMKLTTKFCSEQNMSLETFKNIFFDNLGNGQGHQKRLSTFFVDVSQHFGGRPVVAVYELLKRLYHPGNHRGSWTPEDDQILLREYQKHGPKWTLIGKELNRLAINCRDRYNIKWRHVGKVINGPWSLEEDEKLRNGIKLSLENSGVISWLWISEERVKTRTPLQCLHRWRIIKENSGSNLSTKTTPKPKAKVTREKKTKPASLIGWKEDEDYLLIHSILISGYKSDDEIQWKDLKVPGVPEPRHNPEIFFRRWNLLKSKAEIDESEDLKGKVEKVKKYLIQLSKSPAYIFSEDEEDDDGDYI